MDLLVWAAQTSALTPNLEVYRTHPPSSRSSQTQPALHFSMYSRSAVLASCMESCVPSCRGIGSWQVGAETPGKTLQSVEVAGLYPNSYTTRVGAYIPGGVFHQHWGVYVSFRECIYGKRSQDSFFRLVYPHNDCLKGVLHHPERIHHLVKMVSTTSLREASQRLLLDLLLEPIISQTPQWRNLPQTRWS